MVAICLTVLLLAAGLAIDMGYLRHQSRVIQAAADSAAIAGASQWAGDWSTAAQTDAAADLNIPASQVTLACPLAAPAGSDATPAMCVTKLISAGAGALAVCSSSDPCIQVQLVQNQPTFFMRIAGYNFEPVSARAVATVGNGPDCVYALNQYPVAQGQPVGISTPGSAQVAADANCGMIANGGFSVDPVNYGIGVKATSIGYTGACSDCGGNVTPPPHQIVPSADPLSYLQPPAPPGNCPNGPTLITAASGPTVLSPSTPYPCGIQIVGSINGGPGANVTFEPGLYILGSQNQNTNSAPIYDKTCWYTVSNPCTPVLPQYAGPTTECQTSNPATSYTPCTALSITGDNNTVTGQGVTFYVYTGSVFICVAGNPVPGGQSTGLAPGDGGTGCINQAVIGPVSQDNTITLTAPTSGDYPGVLFYQDRGNYSPATFALDDSNDAGFVYNLSNLQGALYFPNAALTVADLADLNYQDTYTLLIGNEVSLLGTIYIGSDYSVLGNQSLIKDAVLVQ